MPPASPPHKPPSLLIVPLTLDSLTTPPTAHHLTLIRSAISLLLLPCGRRIYTPPLSLRISISAPPASPQAPPPSWQDIHALLSTLYMAAAQEAWRREYPVLNVDVVFDGGDDDRWLADIPDGAHAAVVGRAEDQAELAGVNARRGKNGLGHLRFTVIDDEEGEEEEEGEARLTTVGSKADVIYQPGREGVQAYDCVALGGTFDHLHVGHKILLSVAAFLARKRLVCGVMDASRLARKQGSSQMQPLADRIAGVRAFLRLIRGIHALNRSTTATTQDLHLDVVAITDDYGPTRDDPAIQAIVGSLETRKGCEAVNTLRATNNLPLLDIFTIGVVAPSSSEDTPSSDEAQQIAAKISSSGIRVFLEGKAK
ncbi:uncharacterized protein EV422DRAFT_295390 [Fimicolochytrium jonesii]|uniref:uncharacterized protein n=1 Tax=Fimicolochytrium jonesii TaxID=1396493 RepID=UPI0022FDC9C8|nr:uncharacterized protein EV422DRAFT_295390 [Fimicolochytrium jonesii]KAI8816292.1 hypothetical protein EV422DRAFT_295390 [Fimicolochytrium jonesii]